MKRCKNNKIGLALMVLVLSIIFINPNTVNAAKKADSAACEKEIYSGDVFSDEETADSFIVSMSTKKGKWKVEYWYGDIDYSNIDESKPTGVVTYEGGSSKSIISVPRPENDTQKLIVIAKLDEEITFKDGNKTNKCNPAGKITINKNNNITATGTFATYSMDVLEKNVVDYREFSAEAENECKAMQEARYNTFDSKSYLESDDIKGYRKQMETSFPYCFGGGMQGQFDISEKTIKKVRQSSLEAYKEYVEFLKAKEKNPEYDIATEEIEREGYKLVTYDSKGVTPGPLQCTKDQSEERTEKYYVRNEDVNNSVCKVTCQEQFQVTYDAPVVVKAGLCFQYKVTVKSKVTCKTESNGKINWPLPPETCVLQPRCSQTETQAGPNEEFDSCINECDGGKYSQSCINSCYNKIYKNKKKISTSNNNIKKTSTVSTIAKVERLAKSKNDPFYSDSKCNTNSKIHSNLDHCVEFFYKTKQKYPMGYYRNATKAEKKVKWIDYIWEPCFKKGKDNACDITDEKGNSLSLTIDKTGWSTSTENVVESVKRAVPFYFRNKTVTRKTILSFYGEANGYNGAGKPRKYNIDNHGIKRQYSSSYQCSEVCGIHKVSGGDCKNNSKDIEKHFVEAFDNISAKLKKCTSKAVCKEDTATFSITTDKVNTKTNTNTEDSWSAENYTRQNETCKDPRGVGRDTDVKMFIPLPVDEKTDANGAECALNGINGKCYGKDNSKYWQHYKTTITYPGTWIDLKTSKIYFDKTKIKDMKTVREKENYYCAGYDNEPVNEKWWWWKVNQKGDLTKTIPDPERKDNITATVKQFGKYNWKLNLNCFYALSNSVNDPNCTGDECGVDPPSTGTIGGCESTNSTEVCNAKFRPVTATNLFPDKEGTGTRLPGFNWTSAAKDLTISKEVNDRTGYGIDPGEYAKKIQETAKSNSEANYSGDPDYSLHLTKDNIKALRSYVNSAAVKDKGGYTSYISTATSKNGYTKVNGIDELYYYKSSLLSDTKYVTNFKRNESLLGVNNN